MSSVFEELKGKNAFVTGGNRGIGKSIVKTLIKHGVNVVFTYKTAASEIEEYSEDCRQNDCVVLQFQMNVYDRDNIRSVVSQAESKLGNIHFLINNAGITKDKYLMVMGCSEWEQVIQTNLTGCFLVTKEILPLMLEMKYGAIVNISSVAGLMGVAGQTNYCSSKAGIIGLTKALALEVAGKRIRINAVAPGYVYTNMLDSLTPLMKEKILEKIPMKRIGDPQEIADVVLFLLSDSAGYITGATIPVDGGVTS